MSEFLAEARVLVRPDTTAFRAELATQLAVATRGVVVPVSIAPAAAGTTGITAGLRALDETQQRIKRSAAEAAGGMGELDRQTKKTTSSLLGAGTASAKLNAGLLGLRTAVGSSAVIGLGALSLGAIAAGAAFRGALQATAEFERELNTFRAVTGATEEEIAAVSAAALKLGKDVRLPAVSAGDAATAMTELAKAGLTVEEAINGAAGTLQLATAAQISNADAALIAANALNSFGLAGDQAVKVADVLANAANAAQGSIGDFGLALRQSAAVARQVGLSLEDTTAILSLFAQNGLQGSDAGTSLRVALIRLVAPTKAAAAEIKKLGLDIRDAQGNLRPDIFAQFGEATENLAPSVRDASAALIFGQDAIRAVSIGAREGTDGLRLMQFQIDQTGTAAEVAAARTQGLAGSLSALQSTSQNLGITIGRSLSNPLQNLAGTATNVIIIVDELAQTIKDFNEDAREMRDSIPGGKEAGEFFSFFATPGKAAFETTKILADFVGGTDEVKKQIGDLNEQLQGLQAARIAAERGGQKRVADQLTKEIKALRDEINALKEGAEGISSGVVGPLEEAVATLEKVRDIRIELGVDTTPIDRLIASLTASIPITQKVEGNISRLRDDFGDLGSKARDGAGGVDVLTAALGRLTTQSAIASDQLLKAQNEGASPQRQIEILQGQEQTQRDIIDNLKANGIQAGDPSAIRAARNEIERIQGQIESLQNEIVSDQKAAASSAEQAAKDAQEARDDQFEAIADIFEGRQSNIEDAIARAGIAGNVEAQIRLNKALIASLQKERAALLERLRTLKVSADVRKKIMDAIDAAIEDAQQDILRMQQTQAENIQKLLTTKVDIRIRIAQAQDNVAAEIAARRAKVTIITKELVRLKNAGKKNTIAWLELQAQRAEEIAAIKGLSEQEKDDGKSAQQFFFEQLQAQQGFAANLLGNLIPRDMTAGLVGVPSATTGGAPAPGAGIGAAAGVAAGKDGRGPTAGQANTTNDILLRMLEQLRALNGDREHPEATRQRRTQMSVMDYEHGQGGVM